MVISSPGIYIFSRHNSVWWPNNINTMRTVMSKAFCRHFSIFRKFWIEMLTSTAQIHSSEVIDWIQIEWWPTSTSNFYSAEAQLFTLSEKIQIFQLTFCPQALQATYLYPDLVLPHSFFCSATDFTKKVWILQTCGLLQHYSHLSMTT